MDDGKLTSEACSAQNGAYVGGAATPANQDSVLASILSGWARLAPAVGLVCG